MSNQKIETKNDLLNNIDQRLKLMYLFVLLFLLLCSNISIAQNNNFKTVVFGCYSNDIDEFKRFVVEAKKSGATHIQINAEDLPLAYWQMSPPDDPYPAWVISNPGILLTFLPDTLKKYFPIEALKTAEKVSNILEERCRILRKHNLKAVFHTFEPQMLPEAIYEARPLWRGPQVDHPMRSKIPRFSPSIDNPEVLNLYTEAVKKFITKCPEVDIIYFRTNDSGAGLDWSPYLYNGSNGNTNFKHITMAERVKGLLVAFQKGAAEAGVALAVNVYNAAEFEAQSIALELYKDMAIDSFEGPDANQFKADVDNLLYYSRAFTPIAGIPRPLHFIERLEKTYQSDSQRLFVAIVDRHNKDLYIKIYNKFKKSPTSSIIENLQLLKRIAESEVGVGYSEKLFDLWVALNEAKKMMDLTNAGGTIFNLGCVQQRWLVRPLVPFPSELNPDEKYYYRKHQFQARSESDAEYLLDLQGMRNFTGLGGKRFIQKVIHYGARSYINKAVSLSKYLAEHVSNDKKKNYELLTDRLTAFSYLMNNVFNVVSYQTQLDQLDLSGHKSEQVAIGSSSSVERSKMLGTVRSEIDNTSNLVVLLESQNQVGDIIDHAKSKDEEYIRLLGPDLIDQLKKKIKIMNAHWRDYNRIFTRPNL